MNKPVQSPVRFNNTTFGSALKTSGNKVTKNGPVSTKKVGK